MNLDIVKQNTTWNDASGSINTNFEKIRQAILSLQSEGGGLDEAELEEYLLANGYTKEGWVLEQNALLEERIDNLEQGGGAVNVEGSEFVDVKEGKISIIVDEQGGLGATEQGLGIVDIPSHLLEGIKIDVDSSMSDTSENAVANKVIKKYVDERAEQAYGQANEYTDEEIAGLREELQNGIDHPVFEFTYDTTTNKATAEMVTGLASAISENKLILCNGRTYKFILEDGGMYGLVSDTYLDITDGKLKASILAVTASTYDVQLMEQEVPVGTEITEETVRGWGFTKNAGTITGIKMNGATKGTSGVVDLGNVLTEHQKLKTVNGQSLVGEGDITIQGGGSATPRVEMTAESASIEPNKFYVWPMMDALDVSLGAEQSGVMNRYLFQFRNPKAGLTILTLPDDITWSEDTELDENGLPVMEAAAFYRIEIIEGLASLKKWKLVYINFADAEVERVLMSKGIGDGIGITKRDAASVTDMNNVFGFNEVITEFDEFQYFTGVTRLLSDNTAANHGIGFMGCINLKRITLPSSLTKFGKGSDTSYNGAGAFYGCTSLEYVGNTSHLDYVGDASFYNCKSLIAIDLSSATYIGYNAFENCTSLEQVSLSDSLQGIGGYAFSGCENLELDITGKLALITTLPLGVFNGTKTTGELSMPNLENIPYGYVKQQAFASANLIKILNLGKIREIPDGYNNNVPGVFAKNPNLIFVRLPETLTYIGNRTFYQDASLQTIICEAATPPELHSTAFNATNSTFIIYVPDASVEAYKAATNWNTYASRIKGISEYTG